MKSEVTLGEDLKSEETLSYIADRQTDSRDSDLLKDTHTHTHTHTHTRFSAGYLASHTPVSFFFSCIRGVSAGGR